MSAGPAYCNAVVLGHWSQNSEQRNLPRNSGVLIFNDHSQHHSSICDMKTYKYHPLDQAKKEIRLLVLESINHKGELNYRVEHRSLLHEPDKQYSAVSYRWGRKLDQVTLRLDGEPFQVPRSAAAALRGTHQTANPTMYDGDSDSDEHDRYWIDVICIDQANLEEKASQVAMMGEIYTRAARTLVWLGEEPSCCTSWLAFSLLDAMYEHIKKNTRGLAVLGEHLWSEREEDSRKYRASSLEMPVGDDWHGVNCLFAREWFRRLWYVDTEDCSDVVPSGVLTSGRGASKRWRSLDRPSAVGAHHRWTLKLYRSSHVGWSRSGIGGRRLLPKESARAGARVSTMPLACGTNGRGDYRPSSTCSCIPATGAKPVTRSTKCTGFWAYGEPGRPLR